MPSALSRGCINALTGKGAHAPPMTAIENASHTEARRRPARGLATIWEQFAHMVYWQDFLEKTVPEKTSPRKNDLLEHNGGKHSKALALFHVSAG